MVRFNSNGTITMASMTFYITLFVTLLSLAGGAYGLSRVYTDNKIEVIDTRVTGIESTNAVQMQSINEKFCDIKDVLTEIKTDLKEIQRSQ